MSEHTQEVDEFRIPLDGHMLKTHPDVEYMDGIDPYPHQIQTKKLFNTTEKFVAMNSAPTGSGKSYSYWHPISENTLNTIVLYPRNSLIEDQHRAFEEFFDEFYPSLDVGIVCGTSTHLLEGRQNAMDSVSNGELLYRKLSRARDENDMVLFLTNPDTFTFMRKGLYQDQSVKNILKIFEVAAVDEFHMANRKQKNTLGLLLHEMYDRDDWMENLSKVLFLSATPEREIVTRFDSHTDTNYKHIFSNSGWKPQASVDSSEEPNYRSVLPPVDLTLKPAHTHRTADALLAEASKLTSFCRSGRSLIILDSVSEVRRIHRHLSKAFPDKTVHAISGFQSENKREKLQNFDILVSNSAVEVGIDFDIDKLVFSAHCSETLIQRLGRIRNKNSELTSDKTWKAWCYLPPRAYESLKNSPESPRERMTRPGFIYQVNNSYPDNSVPKEFDIKYSALEGYDHLMSIGNDYAPSDREEYMADAKRRLEQHFFDPHDVDFDSDALARILDGKESKLLEHLKPYRQGGFQTLLFDKTSTGESSLKTYGTIPLTRTGDVEYVERDDFFSRIPSNLKSQAEDAEEHTTGYAIYRGELPPDANIGKVCIVPSLSLRQQIEKRDVLDREPVVTDGLSLRTVNGERPVKGLSILNKHLQQEEVLAYPVNETGFMASRRYGTGAFTFLNDLADTRQQVSVALGHDALYVHCNRLSQDGETSDVPTEFTTQNQSDDREPDSISSR